ncbi:MAG TPA: hypothetical protein VFE25_16010 [Opitutaceae bacterium]|nr:hypothetical protein [Opitutaceae bacterium]
MSELKSLLRLGALGAVAAVCVANVVGVARRGPSVSGVSSWDHDPVVAARMKYARVREALSAKGVSGPIGFIDDLPPGVDADPSVQDYYLAQLWLAPLVLDEKSLGHDWAVMSLHPGRLAAPLPAGWRKERDMGNGVWVLRRVAP